MDQDLQTSRIMRSNFEFSANSGSCSWSYVLNKKIYKKSGLARKSYNRVRLEIGHLRKIKQYVNNPEKKAFESKFAYRFLTRLTKFVLWRTTLLNFRFVIVGTLLIHRRIKIWCYDCNEIFCYKIKKKQIFLKFKSLGWFSQNLIPQIVYAHVRLSIKFELDKSIFS